MKLLNFNEFVSHLNESQKLLLESFNSSIIQSIVTKQREGGIDKKFFDALSKMGIAVSEITNLDITSIDPKDGAKYSGEYPNHILIYYSTTEKENPYVSKDGKEPTVETFNVTQNNSQKTAAFSNWNEFKTDVRKRTYSNTSKPYDKDDKNV